MPNETLRAFTVSAAHGTIARYQMMSWLNFIGTEIHKNYSPLFNPAASDELKTNARSNLAQRYAHVEAMLDGRDYLGGEHVSVADVYLFVVTNWAGKVKLDLSAFPNLQAFQERIAARPAVQQAMRAEGLID